MPYIAQKDREYIDHSIDNLIVDIKAEAPDQSAIAGTLNYAITRIITSLLDGKLNYNNINSMVGMLECCKLELYSRVARNYEDLKIFQNGDVKEIDYLMSTIKNQKFDIVKKNSEEAAKNQTI